MFYSQPGETHIEGHKEILQTLTDDMAKLEGLGTPILMGDANADMIKYAHKPHSVELKEFCRKTKMLSLKDASLVISGALMGKSAPDHILIPKDFLEQTSKLTIHHNISCGSDHRVMTVQCNGQALVDEDIWGNQEQEHTEWSEEETKLYETDLPPSLI